MSYKKREEKNSFVSPFVRFRNGNKIIVNNNIRESTKIFIEAYKKNSNDAFKETIKDIADGSGWGIHLDSTWFRVINELFDLYKDWENHEKNEAFSIIIEILEILAEDRSIEDTWNATIEIIEKKIEILSCWEFTHIKIFGEKNRILREKNGSYYQIESGRKIKVIGTKTIEENKFAFIVDDIKRDFGKIGSLIKLIEMLFISLDFKENSNLYKNQLSYILSESDNNTWFLQGAWRVESAYDLIPIAWHPRNCFTDNNWLKSEVISILSKKCKVSDWAIPKIQPTENKISNWEEAFKNYPLQYEVAYETDIIFEGITTDEVYFEFEGRKLRWINGTRYVYPTLIIPSENENYEEARDISQKFISTIIFSKKYPIRECYTVGCSKRFPPQIRQPRSSLNSHSRGLA